MEIHASHGAPFAIAWAVPFAGLLASMAAVPLYAPQVWHRHYRKVAAAWALALVAATALRDGVGAAAHQVAHVALVDYLPFVMLLAALFVVTGGIAVRLPSRGTTLGNVGTLALGTAIASVIGTTGAAMVLIRPLLHANAWRVHRVHTVIFFIVLVGNVGGALTPLGDPPLFLGFLKGVPFFWTLHALGPATLTVALMLLASYAAVDRLLLRREPPRPVDLGVTSMGLDGAINLVLLAVIVAAVMISGVWTPGVMLGTGDLAVPLQNAVRDGVLALAIVVSLASTPRGVRARIGFSFAPIEEVAVLFAAIFVTIVPVMQMLAAGRDGPFAMAFDLVQPGGKADVMAYFWATGLLSSVLDNAPTYLVFFQFAGGDAARLVTDDAHVLAAMSAGAVYMGALTYIGNAPNLMVRAIAQQAGVAMPHFFAYAAWSALALAPVLMLVGWRLL